jgi:predicted methyltransferase
MDRFLNQIICGDCLEVMRDIPDKSVDHRPSQNIADTSKHRGS